MHDFYSKYSVFYVIVDFAVFCDACLGRHPGYCWAFSGLFIQWYIEVRDI